MDTQIPSWLLELIDQESVTDILVSDQLILVDYGAGLQKITNQLIFEAELEKIARALIELGGRRIDQANPFADVSLPGGLRVHAVLKSACSSGTLISIRLHSENSIGLEDLLSPAFANPRQASLIREIAISGESFLVAGPTGSGKTTLVGAMLAKTTDRVIAIEDVTELSGPNITCLQSREKNIEGAGEITLEKLVRESLRMRPDRLVVGEVRGSELIAMLQALNTGHRGATTLHANSLSAIAERLLSISGATNMPAKVFARLVVSAFDWAIALEIQDGIRRVSGIGKFNIQDGQLRVQEFQPAAKLALA
jgi:pilus assembly protein CpaF